MANFEEAYNASQDLFEQGIPVEDDPAEEQVQTETEAEETEALPVEAEEAVKAEVQTEQQNLLDESTRTAEVAAQMAAENAQKLSEATRQLEIERNKITELQGALKDMSNANEKRVVEELIKPPEIDFDGLAFADDETRRQANERYAQQMAAYNRQEIMKELEPFLNQAKEGMRAKEKADAVAVLSTVKQLEGLEDMMPQIDRIIANNKWLASDDVPIDEKIINAYAIARGVNAINTPPEVPKELTADELLNLYNSNPDFQDAVEKQRIAQLKDSQQVPQHSASSGAVNAALNIPEKPKDWKDASSRSSELFEKLFKNR